MKVALLNPPMVVRRQHLLRLQGAAPSFGTRLLPCAAGSGGARSADAGRQPAILVDPANGRAGYDFRPVDDGGHHCATYLFWRCAQPELRVPHAMISELGQSAGLVVAVGPHGSATPQAALRKLGADALIRGECEEAVVALANGGVPGEVAGTAVLRNGVVHEASGPVATRFTDLPALRWPDEWIARHDHHHHRFDGGATGPGAEVEASRGCPYHCSFCAKIDFRDQYRRRDLAVLLEEIDGLIAQGVTYLYFIDEIFLPNKPLLEALVTRPVQFGIQTRIDLYSHAMLELLGRAGCVSIEAGVESLTEAGRDLLDKKCRMTTDSLADRLIEARRHVPFCTGQPDTGGGRRGRSRRRMA